MNTLQITVENKKVISRFNGEGEGTVLCTYESTKQVMGIIEAHNESVQNNPNKLQTRAVLAAQ